MQDMKKIPLLICIFISFINILMSAQINDDENMQGYSACGYSQNDSDADKEEKSNSLLIFPVLYYTPETKIAGGVLGGYYFYPSNNPDYSKPSSVTLELLYTELEQFKTEITFDIFLSSYRNRLTGAAGYSKFPSKFWGIGNYTAAENETLFIPQSYWLNVSYKRKIIEGLFIGLDYEFNHKNVTFDDPAGAIGLESISGRTGGTVSRAGLTLNADSRDHLMFPTTGSYFQAQFFFSDRALGSDFDFTTLNLDFRKYGLLSDEIVLAGQMFSSLNWGDIPFYYSAFMGGKYLMRGYYEGRYRDGGILAFQAECRLPIYWRIGAALFAGIAQVAPGPGDFRMNAFKFAYGAGLRLLWDKEQKLNIRLDMGFAEDQASLYVTIGEAF